MLTRLSATAVAAFVCLSAFAQTDVSVQMFVDNRPGGDFQYVITVGNSGPAAATNLTLTDVLPSEVVFDGLAATTGWSCSTPLVGSTGTVQCTNASIPSSSSGEVRIFAAAAPGVARGTRVSNAATVTTPTAETTTANNSATRTTALLTRADAAVTITDHPDPGVSGGPVTYTITALNHGPDAAVDAVLELDPVGAASIDSLSAPAGWTCTSPPSPDDDIVCTASSFAVGSASFALRMITEGGSDPRPCSRPSRPRPSRWIPQEQVDGESTSLASQGAFLEGVKQVSPANPPPGTNVTYTIDVTNGGNIAQGDNPPATSWSTSFPRPLP